MKKGKKRIKKVRLCPICGNEIEYVNYKYEIFRCMWCKEYYNRKEFIFDKAMI